MKPVAPDIGFPEVSLAKDQPEYLTLTAAQVPHDDGTVGVVTRWRLTDEECAQLVLGADLYLVLLTADGQPQPVVLTVGNPYEGGGP